MSNINTVYNWFKSREGKVTYSMTYRNGPNSYDCSSAVYFALIEGGFLPSNTGIGNTDSLFRLEGSVLVPINRGEVRFGDIFVAGNKGASGGAFGHTGLAVDNNTIIHCNGADNGISTTPISGRTGSPVYWYRLADGNYSTTGQTVKVKTTATHYSPTSKALAIPDFVKGQTYPVLEKRAINYSNSTFEYLLGDIMSWVLSQDIEGGETGNPSNIGPSGAWKAETGTFTPNQTINVRSQPSVSSERVAEYGAGQAVYYDKYLIDANGYVWIHYTSFSGQDRYMATGESRNGVRITYWGSFY